MKRSSWFKKIVAFSLSLALCGNAFCGDSSGLWSQRRQTLQALASPLSITAPAYPSSPDFVTKALAFGSTRPVRAPQGKTSPVRILHIQDVHMNAEAQLNISRALDELMKSGRVDLVALEGAFRPIRLEGFRSYPHQESVVRAADTLLASHQMTGAIHAGLKHSGRIPPFVGVDDPVHYRKNVGAYTSTRPAKEKILQRLDSWGSVLSEQKAAAFTPELLKFDHVVESYRAGSLNLRGYAAHLVHRTPQIETYLRTVDMESRIHFSDVEKQRTALLTALAQKLSSAEAAQLAADTAAYQSGQFSHADFYTRIRLLARQKNISLEKTPAMEAYWDYLVHADRIDPDQLLVDLQVSEGRTFGALAQTSTQHQLIRQSRLNFLSRRLAEFSLTKDEWTEYKALARADKSPVELSSFAAFYQEAEARDQAMAENLLRAIQTHQAKTAVLITGGFHSAGMAAHLNAAGATIVPFVPKITRLDDESGGAYLSVFTREKGALDKIFDGHRIFITPPVDSPALQRNWSLAVAAEEMIQGRLNVALTYFKRIILGGAAGLVFSWRWFRKTLFIILTERGCGLVRFDRQRKEAVVETAGVVWPAIATSGIKLIQQYVLPHPPRGLRVPRKLQNNLNKTWKIALAKFPVLQNGRTVNYRVVSDISETTRLDADGTVLIHIAVLAYPNLLFLELIEEFRHLSFRRLMEGRAMTQEELTALLAVEEIATDIAKLQGFSRDISPGKRAELINELFGLDELGFYRLFLRELPPDEMRRVIGNLTRMKGSNLGRQLLNEELSQELIDSSFNADDSATDETYVSELVEFYRMVNPYPAYRNYYTTTSIETIIHDLRHYRRLYHEALEDWRHGINGPPKQFQLIPGVSLLAPGRRRLLSAQDVKKSGLKKVVGDYEEILFLEPHHDDGAISSGTLLAALAFYRRSVLRIVTFLRDYLGVTDEFVRAQYGIHPNVAITNDIKEGLRRSEGEAYARSLGLSFDQAPSLGLDLPVQPPVRLETDGSFNALLNQFEDFKPEDKARIIDYLKRNVEGKNVLLALPWPYQVRPPNSPAEHIHHAHPHHKAVLEAVLEGLREIKYDGPVLFYEVPERLANFDSEHLAPNLVVSFNGNEMRGKQEGIANFKSQVQRKPYGEYARTKDTTNAQREKIATHPYAERFIWGHLKFSNAADPITPPVSQQPRAPEPPASSLLSRVIVSILGGGKSLSLWPINKLFVSTPHGKSVILETIRRFIETHPDPHDLTMATPDRLTVVTSPENSTSIHDQLTQLAEERTDWNISPANVFKIPTSDSGDLNGMLWAMAKLRARIPDDQDEPLIFSPGDTIVNRPFKLGQLITEGLEIVQKNPHGIVMLGREPPSTAPLADFMRFGSLQADLQNKVSPNGYKAKNFIEKAPEDMAQTMKAEGTWHFNLAVYIGMLSAFEKAVQEFQSPMYVQYRQMVEAVRSEDNAAAERVFEAMSAKVPHPLKPGETIYPIWDYLITMEMMRHPQRDTEVQLYVIPSNIEFHDVGNWQAYYDALKKDPMGNAIAGEGELDYDNKSRRNLFYAERNEKTLISQVIVARDVQDLVIVQASDGDALVMPISQTGDIKALFSRIQRSKSEGRHMLVEGARNTDIYPDPNGFILVGKIDGFEIIQRAGHLIIKKKEDRVVLHQGGPKLSREDVEFLASHNVTVPQESHASSRSTIFSAVAAFFLMVFTYLPALQAFSPSPVSVLDTSPSAYSAALDPSNYSPEEPLNLGVSNYSGTINPALNKEQRIREWAFSRTYEAGLARSVDSISQISRDGLTRVSVYEWTDSGDDRRGWNDALDMIQSAAESNRTKGVRHDVVILSSHLQTEEARQWVLKEAGQRGVAVRFLDVNKDFSVPPVTYKDILARAVAEPGDLPMTALNDLLEKTYQSARFETYSRGPLNYSLDSDLENLWIGFFNFGRGWVPFESGDLKRTLEAIALAMKAA